MPITVVDITRADVLWSFFCEGMLAGYASNRKPEALTDHRYFKKRFVYKACGLTLIDEWNDHGGRTMIYEDDVLVWIMQYEGHYEDDVIPFLKQTLADAYKRFEFNGGRGLQLVDVDRHLIYTNYVDPNRNRFEQFLGSEEICRIGAPVACGRHDYWGGLLIPSHSFR